MVLNTLLCYTHDDEKMVRQCRSHLSVLEGNQLITIQDQGAIQPGEEWKKVMNSYLTQADIILLFISASFLASRYHYEEVMIRAIARHERKENVRVIPVILRFCAWRDVPPLDKLLPLPEDGEPIEGWRLKNKGYLRVVDGIKKVIEQWRTRSLPGPSPEREGVMTDFDRLTEAVLTHLEPPGRATHTASTLQQLSVLTPAGVTLADLATAWRVLARPHQPAEADNMKGRRVTCGELADLAGQITSEPGDLTRALKAWQSWTTAFEKSDDPRQAAMAKTFAREYGELQAEIQA